MAFFFSLFFSMTTLPQLDYEPNDYSDCYTILIKYVLIKFGSLIHLFLSTETLRENNSINSLTTEHYKIYKRPP